MIFVDTSLSLAKKDVYVLQISRFSHARSGSSVGKPTQMNIYTKAFFLLSDNTNSCCHVMVGISDPQNLTLSKEQQPFQQHAEDIAQSICTCIYIYISCILLRFTNLYIVCYYTVVCLCVAQQNSSNGTLARQRDMYTHTPHAIHINIGLTGCVLQHWCGIRVIGKCFSYFSPLIVIVLMDYIIVLYIQHTVDIHTHTHAAASHPIFIHFLRSLLIAYIVYSYPIYHPLILYLFIYLSIYRLWNNANADRQIPDGTG